MFNILLYVIAISFVFATLPTFNEKERREKLDTLNTIALDLWGKIQYSRYVAAELFLEANPTITDKDKLKTAMSKNTIKPINAEKYTGQTFVDCVGLAGITKKKVENTIPTLKGTIVKYESTHGAVRFDFLLKKSASDKAVKGTFFIDVGSTAASPLVDNPVIMLMHGGEEVKNPSDVAKGAKFIRSYRFNHNYQVIEKDKKEGKEKDCLYENTTLELAMHTITEANSIDALLGIKEKTFFFMERYARRPGQKKTYSNIIDYNNDRGEIKLVDLHKDDSLPSKKGMAKHSQGLNKLRAFLGNKSIAAMSIPKPEASLEETEAIIEDVFNLFK